MGIATKLLLAAEEAEHGAEEPSGIDLILPAVDELLWGAICFAIVAFFLTRVAFPKLRQAVQDREAKIQEAQESAERARAEANKQLEDYKRQVADARSEANRIIEEARQSAEQVRKDIIAKAEKEAEGVVARAQEQIQAERTRTIQELQGTIANLSVELAERVVGRSLDKDSQRDLVDAYIRDVSAMSSGNGGATS